jgi:hypothetical protein
VVLAFLQASLELIHYVFVGRAPFDLLTGALAVAFLVGLVAIFVQRRLFWIGVTLLTALTLGFAFERLGLFVYGDRQTLYAAPLIILSAAYGLSLIQRLARRLHLGRVYLLLLIVLWGAIGARSPLPFLNNAQLEYEEVRSVMDCIASTHQAGEVVFVYYGAGPAVRYYGSRYEYPVVFGEWSRGQPVAEQVAKMVAAWPGERGWVLFSHALEHEDELILGGLREWGRPLVQCEAHNARAVLFQKGS